MNIVTTCTKHLLIQPNPVCTFPYSQTCCHAYFLCLKVSGYTFKGSNSAFVCIPPYRAQDKKE